MIQVIVVPETNEFKEDVSHENIVYVSLKLGVPNLDGRDARYVAPCWLHAEEPGVRRIYHILSTFNDGQNTILRLGNSFLLEKVWNGMGQSRRYEYHALKSFDYVEVQEGYLMKFKA